MNIERLKDDIFDSRNPERQYKAAYSMRYVQNDQEVVQILFSACYEAKDPRLQQEAVRSLGILQPDRALNTFIKSTYNRDSGKRMRAYFHLGTLGDPKGVDEIIKGFSDSNVMARRAAVISAGRIACDYTTIEDLKRLLNGFEPESIKKEVWNAIDNIQKRLSNKRSFNNNNNRSFKRRDFNKPVNNRNNNNRIRGDYTPKAF